MDLDGFDPRYLVTLDELYHPHWAARKRRRIGWLRDVVERVWPHGPPARLIQVTGTNGKGTVSHFLEQGLRGSGRAGSWTGPHVFDYAERFHLDGEQASRAEISAVYRERLIPIQDAFCERNPGESLSFAELGILLALHLFERHGLRWGVMEVGAGGRYTPLMALPMAACVVTNVGHDHPKTLGTELWQRALEKAGVARPGVPLFTAAEGDALGYVTRAAEAEGARVHAIDDAAASRLELPAELLDGLPRFQRRNLALACAVISTLDPTRERSELLAAMRARLTGRFWQPAPNVLVDVAHNAEKIAGLAESLRAAYPGRPLRLIVGLTRSRDVVETFAPLRPLARRVVVTSASYAGQDPSAMAARLREVFPEVAVEPAPRRAYELERAALAPGELLVVTGSAYMIDLALNPNPYIQHTNASFGRRGPSLA